MRQLMIIKDIAYDYIMKKIIDASRTDPPLDGIRRRQRRLFYQ